MTDMPPDAGTAPLVSLRFDTALVPPDDRFAAWQRALANFDLSRNETEPFAARAQVWLLHPLIMTHAHVDPLRYDRHEGRARRDGHDHLAMVYLFSGSFVGDYGDGVVASGAGSLTVLDLEQACWTQAERLEAVILSVPRDFIAPALGSVAAHGTVATDGCAPLLGAVLREVLTALPTLTAAHAGTIAAVIRDLVARTLLDAHARGVGERPREDALVARVRTHIDRHLAEGLDSVRISEAMGISRSTLYRAFEQSGGVQHQVQRRRLHALRAALADSGDTRSISEIAGACGFVDQSHATRLFKRAYGLTPGQFRQASANGAPVADGAGDVPDTFRQWTTRLD